MTAGEAYFALTCGQRWLLHLWEQEPDLARPVQRLYRLCNHFDPSAFLEALEHTVASHPALRLRLVHNEHGWQQYFPGEDVVVSGEDIRGRTPEVRAAYAGMLMAEEARATWDLQKEAPVKAKIVRVDGDHLLSLCVDHLAADEIAFDLFEQALAAAYGRVIDDRPAPPSLPDPFFTYLSKELAQQHTEPEHLLFWQQQLHDAPMNGGADQTGHWVAATVLEHTLSGETFESLLRWCRTHKCSLFNAVIAIQLLLISDISGEDDIVLNIPVSNRARADERSIIANLSMLLHVRFELVRDEPLTRLVLRVRDRVLTAMAHRQYDYPSLSGYIAAEAQRRGLATGWLRGCNFVKEDAPAVFPNRLFEERMDNQAGKVYDIPRTSFTVVARQTGSSLRLLMDWDADTWPVAAGMMEQNLLEILQRLQR